MRRHPARCARRRAAPGGARSWPAMLKLPFLPFKLVFFLGRTIGWTRLLFLLIGIAVGLAVAPMTGAELREKLQARAATAAEVGAPA